MAAFIGKAVPAQIVRASGTSLFQIAADKLGDATQWNRIAALNNIADPWLTTLVELKIPQPGTSNGGIYYA